MAESVAFIGGMNVPALLGRATATIPLAQLVVDDRRLILRTRGIARVLVTDFVVDLDMIATAFRLRGTMMTAGVGIRLHDGVVAYFWTLSKQDAVLSALAERGIPIELGAHRARGLWSIGGHRSDAVLPTLPALLQTMAPVLVLLGTAIVGVLFIMAELWWMRLVLVLIWVYSTVSALALWSKGRRRDPR